MAQKRTPPDAIVFFDIDGTLIRRAGPHHREALIEAVRRATGLETTIDGIPLHGMLDPEILTAMMRNAGASRALIRARCRRSRGTRKLFTRGAARRSNGRSARASGGFSAGCAAPAFAMGLVSGNFTRIGWKKVERAGLKHHFSHGRVRRNGERPGRPAPARHPAGARARMDQKGTRVSLVGDTPSDVKAARANRRPRRGRRDRPLHARGTGWRSLRTCWWRICVSAGGGLDWRVHE